MSAAPETAPAAAAAPAPSASPSADQPARHRGKFSRRNAKRKARREGTTEEGDATKKPRVSSDPSKAAATPKHIHSDGGFMVDIPDCPKFNEYYQAQNLMTAEEWPAFMAALKTKLPTTFRLSTISGTHYDLLHQLTHELQATPEENAAGGEQSYSYRDPQTGEKHTIEPPKPLAWYPDSLGWYIRAGKSELKTKGNKFEAFRKFLMHQYDAGGLNRQEAVSMIPPLLLDVQPHHIVLDMCAAPGSKTAQLLEGLHGGVHYSESFKTPSGMVIANDADYKRAYLLVHQLKRYGSSAFLVTTHDGQQFPNLYQNLEPKTDAPAAASVAASVAPSTDAAAAPAAATADKPAALIQFDRILCDVPCSGDGTLRKNMPLWRMWDTKFANGLHHLQLMIACRAVEMLKVGGLVVYSTCSFNPTENESVVIELLRRAKGALELVDVSAMLPGLIRRPGLTTWKVRDTLTDAWAQADDPTIIAGKHPHLRASMFPPTAEEVEKYQPQRCMRVLPHDQDTGGFFICLLRKTGETPASMKSQRASGTAAASPTGEADAEAAEDAASAAVLAELPDLDGEGGGVALPAGLDDPETSNSHKAAVGKKGQKETRVSKKQMFNEDPFEPMHADTVARIIDFYGMAHGGVDQSNFFTRSDVNRKCYFVAPAIARILHCAHNKSKLKIVHTGSRCYERGTKPEDATFTCQFRIVQEGVESVLPFMTKQVMYPSFEEAVTLLYKYAWPFKEMRRDPGPNNEDQFYRSIIQHKNGCIVMVIKGSEIAKHCPTYTTLEAGKGQQPTNVGDEAVVPTRRSVPLCVWKTPHSISLMVNPVDQNSLLHLLDPNEKLMPPEVRAKREAAKKAELRKEEERRAKQEAHQARKANDDDTTPTPSTLASSPEPSPSPSAESPMEE